MKEMEDYSDCESDCSTPTTYSDFVEDPPNKRYKCSYENCQKSFYRPSKLEDHKRIHTGEKPFKCEISNCDKSYHRKQHLKKHQEQVHFKNIKYIECPVEGCGQKMRQNSFQKHKLRKHNSFRIWKFHCKECDKGFSKNSELANHMNEHSIIFRCATCDKQFKKKALYNKHVRAHKEYECICLAKFYDCNIFRTHKKECEFTKPSCGICNKLFSKNGNLKDHLTIVHGISQDVFKCTVEGCTKQYNRKNNLKLHIANSHEAQEVKFSCSICSRILKNKVNLWRHMKTVHINENRKNDKPRKTRRDKNIPKIPMLTILTGIKHKETNSELQNVEKEPKDIPFTEVTLKPDQLKETVIEQETD